MKITAQGRPTIFAVTGEASPLPQRSVSGKGHGTTDAFEPSRAAGARAVGAKQLSPSAVKTAVVIGAGPAGLLAALELVQNGVSVTLIEQRDMYTRPIHFNIRGSLLHRLAETVPQVLPKIMERLGAIERVETIDGTRTSITPEELAELQKKNHGRDVLMTPGGLKISRPGPEIPTPDAQKAGYNRDVLSTPSIGQIWVVDLEQILFEELERLSKQPTTGGQPTVTILREARSECTIDRFGNYSVEAYGVRAGKDPQGKPTWERTGERTPLGIPDLVVCAEGANSETRKHEEIPHTFVADGTTYVAGMIEGSTKTDKAPNGGLVRRRYAEATDPSTGEISGLRQVIVGHAKRDKSWVLVEVPKFLKLEGKEVVDRYFREQAAMVLERPLADVNRAHVSWGPSPFVMQQNISKTATKGNNMVFIGDAVGNAHFLSSGGLMTACVPHVFALERLLQSVADGVPRAEALRRYDLLTRASTKEWLRVGYREFGRQGTRDFDAAFKEELAKARERLGCPPEESAKGAVA